MKKETLFFFLLCGVVSGFLFSLTSGAGEMITDEKLYEMIGGKSHTVMAKQRERLQEVLQGFLAGDWQRIQAPLSRMRQDIDQIGSQYVQYSDSNIPSLQALDEMRKEITALQAQLTAKKYKEAYAHFQAIPYQCIQCHQAQRSWGKFETVKEGEEAEETEGAEAVKKKDGSASSAPAAAVTAVKFE